MMYSLYVCIVAACFSCSPSQRIQASDRPAGEILAEIDAIKAATPNPLKDPALLARVRSDPAASEELKSRQLAVKKRTDELTWSLYKSQPDHERIPELLRSRWMYRMRNPATADETLAEIDGVLAEAKDARLVTEVTFLRAEATIRKFHGRPAAEFMDSSMPAIEAAIRRAPKDERGAGFLYALMTGTKGLPERTVAEFGDRILRDYPSTTIAMMVKKARDPRIGKPVVLDFKDEISGAQVSIGALKGKVVVIHFWATWCVPCIREMPDMKDIHARYHQKGVEFIGVSCDRPKEEGGLDSLKAFVTKNGITWPQYYQGGSGEATFSRSQGVSTIPAVFVVDREGILVSIDAQGKLSELIPTMVESSGRSSKD